MTILRANFNTTPKLEPIELPLGFDNRIRAFGAAHTSMKDVGEQIFMEAVNKENPKWVELDIASKRRLTDRVAWAIRGRIKEQKDLLKPAAKTTLYQYLPHYEGALTYDVSFETAAKFGRERLRDYFDIAEKKGKLKKGMTGDEILTLGIQLAQGENAPPKVVGLVSGGQAVSGPIVDKRITPSATLSITAYGKECEQEVAQARDVLEKWAAATGTNLFAALKHYLGLTGETTAKKRKNG
jgi:hypothetical protein